MTARLVRLDAGHEISKHIVERPEYLIGRDHDADLYLEAPLVSRRHALLRDEGGYHSLTDLASANGTTLNGVHIAEPVVLESGDLIQLGGDVTLRYEVGDERRIWPWLIGLLLTAAFGGGTAWYVLRPDPVMTRATTLAAEGWAAFQEGDAEGAKSRIRAATGELLHTGRLDHVPRADVMVVALERLSARIEGEPDLASVFRQSLEQSRPTAAEERHAPAGCRLDRSPPDRLPACLRQRIELVLLDLRQDPKSVPETFHQQVGARLRKEHQFLRNSLERGRRLVPMLEEALEAEHMPPKLHYLALIESGYRPDAVSPAGAAGLWQFMPATARQYELRVGGGVDDRRDPIKSTHAAARYLNDLAFEFGGDALLLAIASYNRGENGMRRALRKMNDPFSDRSYWRLVERGLLPEETAHYVPRFLAAAVAGEGGVPRPETLEAAGYR